MTRNFLKNTSNVYDYIKGIRSKALTTGVSQCYFSINNCTEIRAKRKICESTILKPK